MPRNTSKTANNKRTIFSLLKKPPVNNQSQGNNETPPLTNSPSKVGSLPSVTSNSITTSSNSNSNNALSKVSSTYSSSSSMHLTDSIIPKAQRIKQLAELKAQYAPQWNRPWNFSIAANSETNDQTAISFLLSKIPVNYLSIGIIGGSSLAKSRFVSSLFNKTNVSNLNQRKCNEGIDLFITGSSDRIIILDTEPLPNWNGSNNLASFDYFVNLCFVLMSCCDVVVVVCDEDYSELADCKVPNIISASLTKMESLSRLCPTLICVNVCGDVKHLGDYMRPDFSRYLKQEYYCDDEENSNQQKPPIHFQTVVITSGNDDMVELPPLDSPIFHNPKQSQVALKRLLQKQPRRMQRLAATESDWFSHFSKVIEGICSNSNNNKGVR